MVRIMLPYIEHPAQAAKVAVYAGSFYPAWAFCQIVSIRFGEMYFRETVSRQTACLYDFCLTSTPFLKVNTKLVYDGLFHQRIPGLGHEVIHRPGGTSQVLQEAGQGAHCILLRSHPAPMFLSLFSNSALNTARDFCWMASSAGCGVLHFCLPLNFPLHCHTARWYLLWNANDSGAATKRGANVKESLDKLLEAVAERLMHAAKYGRNEASR